MKMFPRVSRFLRLLLYFKIEKLGMVISPINVSYRWKKNSRCKTDIYKLVIITKLGLV